MNECDKNTNRRENKGWAYDSQCRTGSWEIDKSDMEQTLNKVGAFTNKNITGHWIDAHSNINGLKADTHIGISDSKINMTKGKGIELILTSISTSMD